MQVLRVVRFVILINSVVNITNVILVRKSIEEMFQQFEDEKNSVIAVSPSDDTEVYEDFYEELDNWMDVSSSMNIIYFGPSSSFMRIDVESLLHMLQHTKKHLIPISKVLLAWNLVTDGKTAAFLQGRDYLAFGSLLNVVPEEDLYYVNFGDPTVLKYFSMYLLNLHSRKYGILAASYVRYYGNVWYTNGSSINEMGYLICGFPAGDLRLITPEAFLEINMEIFSKLQRCTVDQIQTLYQGAVHSEAYGHPYTWSSHEVTNLGDLVACVPEDQIPSIQLEAVTALTPEILKLMPQNKLLHFTKQQIYRMSEKARRILILRLQLMNSLDVTLMLTKKSSCVIYPVMPVSLIALGLVTLFT